MKQRLYIICVAVVAAMAAWGQQKLVILHTNDTHSAIMPLSRNLGDTLLAGRGGYLRRMELVRREREAEPGLLLFDSGDFSQGSPYYTLFKGDVEVGLMNMMRYDAATLGNHEFDFGLDNLARLLRKARFPVVCANYDFSGTPLEGLVKPYVVIEREGLRVGVFGLSPRLDGLVAKENYGGVVYNDPVEAARKAVKALRSGERCDVVVCLSHLGWAQAQPDIDDSTMIAGTQGIDLVLGGHSHSYFEKLEHVRDADGRSVPVDQNGKHGVFVGKMEMSLKVEGKHEHL